MERITFLTAIISSLVGLAMAGDYHCLSYKSATTVMAECRKLLGYSPHGSWYETEPCQVYCGTRITRMWNEELGEPLISNSGRFQHVGNDTDHFQRTVNNCWENVKASVPKCDHCSRADAAFSCFNTANTRNESFFIPQTDLQHRRVLLECVNMLQITSHELDFVKRSGLLNHPKGRCLVRCLMIREQLYSEVNGVDVFRTLVQRGVDGKSREFRKHVANCVQYLQRCFLDRCTLAARIAAECFGERIWPAINKIVEDL
ncbi:general odorant-binding protein 45-like [Uranotaenia lowii]|uniref:general odorant-binding protein 45-like n=1 Tax=Uranotaenia lowii TaxID=190385 RepID=UPI00247AD0D2|nr:general odorant-binding protein 45-like [Uranotaenia lowii]